MKGKKPVDIHSIEGGKETPVPEDVNEAYFKPKKLSFLTTPKKEFCSGCGKELEDREFRTFFYGELLCKDCFKAQEKKQDDTKNGEDL